MRFFFTFQPQDEIISRKQLFHRQNEPFIPQAIKDVLPYFLGAISDDHVSKSMKVRKLRHDLRGLDRKMSEYEAIRGEGMSRAQSLLSEAQDSGLHPIGPLPENLEKCIEALQESTNKPFLPEEELVVEGEEFENLQNERVALIEELHRVRDQHEAAKALARDKQDYTKEVDEQTARLKSIGLFETKEENSHSCPLCKSELGDEVIPEISELENAVEEIEEQVRTIEERSPQLQGVVRSLEERLDDTKLRLRNNREALEAVQRNNIRMQALKDREARRAYIIGRIGLYLESLPELEDNSELKQRIAELKESILALEDEINEETIKENLNSILSRMAGDMNRWAQELDLEYSKDPLRLDLSKLTVVSDSEMGRPIPLAKMGSAENWVGYHLIVHFALHKWFVKKKRPVPRFLFIDQPSEVYFPADKDIDGAMEGIEEEDREKVVQMYYLAFNVIKQLTPNFQIIATDHADINQEWFQESVVERWRGDVKLVPLSWIEED